MGTRKLNSRFNEQWQPASYQLILKENQNDIFK